MGEVCLVGDHTAGTFFYQQERHWLDRLQEAESKLKSAERRGVDKTSDEWKKLCDDANGAQFRVGTLGNVHFYNWKATKGGKVIDSTGDIYDSTELLVGISAVHDKFRQLLKKQKRIKGDGKFTFQSDPEPWFVWPSWPAHFLIVLSFLAIEVCVAGCFGPDRRDALPEDGAAAAAEPAQAPEAEEHEP